MNHTTDPCGVEPNFNNPQFTEELITLPAPSASGRTFEVAPLSSASEMTKVFISEFGPHFKLHMRAFNPKKDRFFIFLSSAGAGVGKWIDEDEVLLVANFSTDDE